MIFFENSFDKSGNWMQINIGQISERCIPDGNALTKKFKKQNDVTADEKHGEIFFVSIFLSLCMDIRLFQE